MKRLLAALLCLVLFTGCSSLTATEQTQPQAPQEDLFTLSFLTIGKGDAFLLSTPEGRRYLVDTGKDQDYPQIARALRVKNIDRLDGIFLTHGHKDHVGSLDSLLRAFPTEKVFYSGLDSVTYDEILPWEAAEAHGAQAVALEGGETIDLGGATALVWLPPEPDTENENNNSLVLLVTYGDTRFLLMGDAELEEEKLLLDSGLDLHADILKLGHHGEDDASSPAFLDAVQPKIGLVAGNQEENPESMDPIVAALLAQRDIRCFYSESTGLGLDFSSDGKKINESVLKDRDLPQSLSLSFEEVDRKGQRVTIHNKGSETADLTGCTLYSLRRDEIFFFPDRTMLEPGKSLTVACLDAEKPGDLTWEQESVWQKKRDDAYLFDRNMNILDLDEAEDN